ncbi:MAG: hypothetical protein IJF37_04445 [Lachnospiraceae bacterium]|nr:hypothetical protein [Lachnospiraceae bacterium]
MDRLDKHLTIYAVIMVVVVIVLISVYTECVYASDTDTEVSTVDIETTSSDDVVVNEDAEHTVFGFYTQTQESNYMMTKIYNLLLTIFYFLIIDTGRKVIVRNLRKGHTDGAFNG